MEDRSSFALERAFIDAARKRAEFLSRHDAKRANRQYDRIHAIKGEMRSLPDRGEAALKRILLNGPPHVRLMAAVALLAVDELQAMEVLAEIAAQACGSASVDAALTMREWQAGNLREYWG